MTYHINAVRVPNSHAYVTAQICKDQKIRLFHCSPFGDQANAEKSLATLGRDGQWHSYGGQIDRMMDLQRRRDVTLMDVLKAAEQATDLIFETVQNATYQAKQVIRKDMT